MPRNQLSKTRGSYWGLGTRDLSIATRGTTPATGVFNGSRRKRARRSRTGVLSVPGQVDIAGHGTVLALSRTYVNLSGEAAEYLLTRYRAAPERLIVVSDDINLRVGAIRIRKQGSAGGHKGLKSITAAIGTDKFKRVRIGVGKPASPDKQVEHVLGVPEPDEQAVLDESVGRAAGAVKTIIVEGVEISMNRFNSMAPAGGENSACGPGDQTRD